MQIGPYRVLHRIAVGGMGEVSLATLERAGGFRKLVALKQALPAMMADPAFVEMFEREARLAAVLNHRNIVQIFDFGRHDGVAWIAMEYVHGVDLRAVLDLGPPPPSLAVEIGLGCARGLAYAHRATDAGGKPLGLVHRDVSPHNVLLSFEGDVKVADFGLALPTARRAGVAGLQGKFGYMSPEQVAGADPDARSDQFALGAVLYELCSGRRAFWAEDGAEAILERVGAATPLEPLSAVAPDLAPGVVAVVERALARAPEARFPDVQALAEGLAAAASAAGIGPAQPALGPWLAARFPQRTRVPSVPPGGVAEVTATAAAPIAPMREASGQQPDVRRAPRRWPAVLLALAALGGLGALLMLEPPPPDAAEDRDGGRADAVMINVATPDGATPDGATPDMAARDALSVDAPPPDAAAAPITAPPRPKVRAPRTRAPRSAAPRTSAPDSVAPVSAAPVSVAPAPPPSAPPTDAAPAPRVRVRGPGAAVRGTPWREGWYHVPAAGVLASAGSRPRVQLRLRPQADRFLATITSNPFGTLFVDGRDMGPTPAAAVPLRPGRRVIEVRIDGGNTRLVVEVVR